MTDFVTRDVAARSTPRFAVKRYGRGQFATSRGWSLELRVGSFYLHLDIGKIL